ncbi:hypothetical protein TYRP_003154 [Tyrophagus putrescentiae]|nr:hypothetical protein TYRP_003154 [Tyrophagus putrescentiae]
MALIYKREIEKRFNVELELEQTAALAAAYSSSPGVTIIDLVDENDDDNDDDDDDAKQLIETVVNIGTSSSDSSSNLGDTGRQQKTAPGYSTAH